MSAAHAERAAAAAALFTDAERERLLTLRRTLHAHPELSWAERGTQATLKQALLDAGITDVREIADTGLVARIPGTRAGARPSRSAATSMRCPSRRRPRSRSRRGTPA